MKKFFFILFFSFCLVTATNAQSVSVNTDGTTADASAILDVKSTTKGVLVPRVTTAQRGAIVSPANGLLVYDTDVKSFWYYNGTVWTNITGSGGGGSLTLPFEATVNTPGIAFKIANGNTAIEGSSINNPAISGYSENGSGVRAHSAAGFGLYATSTQATAIMATSFNTNPTIRATNSHATGTAIEGSSTSHIAIAGTSGGAGKSAIFGVSTSATGNGVQGYNATGTGILGASNTGIGVSAISNGTALNVNGNVKIAGGNTAPGTGKVLTSDANGNATWKGAVAFRASDGINQVVPNDMTLRVLFTSESHDLGTDFDVPSSSFTVPEKGLYHFDVSIGWRHDLYTHASAWLVRERNGVMTTVAYTNNHFDYTYVWEHYDAPVVNRISTDLVLEPGDKIYVNVKQTNTDTEERTLTSYNCSFSGHLVTRL